MRTRKHPPRRSADQTQITVSLPTTLREAADERARLLGLNRSSYISQLIRAEAQRGGALVLAPASSIGTRKKRS